MTINERVSDERLAEYASQKSDLANKPFVYEDSRRMARELQQYRAAADEHSGHTAAPAVHALPVLQNFRAAMEGIGHIRRTLEETFGGLHGTHCEPDILVECKEICDAIYAAYRKTGNSPVIPDGSTCKYCGGSGYFRWQQSYDRMPCPCKGCTEFSAPQQESK